MVEVRNGELPASLPVNNSSDTTLQETSGCSVVKHTIHEDLYDDGWFDGLEQYER